MKRSLLVRLNGRNREELTHDEWRTLMASSYRPGSLKYAPRLSLR
jgi:hypothetical protein